MGSAVGPASGLLGSVVESTSGLAVASALTDGAASAAPTAKTSEQPKRKCFPFLIIRQFFCSAFLRLKYML